MGKQGHVHGRVLVDMPGLSIRGIQRLQLGGGGLCSNRGALWGGDGRGTVRAQPAKIKPQTRRNWVASSLSQTLNAEPHEYGAGRPDEQGRRRGRPGKFDFSLVSFSGC